MLAASLLIVGCGGVGNLHTIATSATSSTVARTTSATHTSTTHVASHTRTAASTSTTSSATPSAVQTVQSTTTAPPPTNTTANANLPRVPATFVLKPGGTMFPPAIGFPAGVGVRLTIISSDSAGHMVVVHTPTQHQLRLAPRGHPSLLIPPLKTGHYPVDVDGVMRGQLLVGTSPGP